MIRSFARSAAVTVPADVPNNATITLRLNSGYVVWIDYLTPGQMPSRR